MHLGTIVTCNRVLRQKIVEITFFAALHEAALLARHFHHTNDHIRAPKDSQYINYRQIQKEDILALQCRRSEPLRNVSDSGQRSPCLVLSFEANRESTGRARTQN